MLKQATVGLSKQVQSGELKLLQQSDLRTKGAFNSGGKF